MKTPYPIKERISDTFVVFMYDTFGFYQRKVSVRPGSFESYLKSPSERVELARERIIRQLVKIDE